MQLPLPVQLPEDKIFDIFITGDNQLLVSHLKTSILQSQNLSSSVAPLCYLQGKSGAGKSHLMYACCHFSKLNTLSHVYFDMTEIVNYPTDVFIDLEDVSLIYLDNIHAISGNDGWERAIFNLINAVMATKRSQIIMSSVHGPKNNSFSLPDLTSRITWGLCFHLNALSDDEKISALNLACKQRGLKVKTAVLNYLLAHFDRDMHALMQAIATLDTASLQAQRTITVPFVKQELLL